MDDIGLLKKPFFWLACLAGLVWAAVVTFPPTKLRLYFCNVGQGDAALIVYKDKQILIDGGPGNAVMECLAKHIPFWDRELELVILSHPQTDHYSGLVNVIESYKVNHFVINAVWLNTPSWQEFYKVAMEEGAPVYAPQAGDKIKIGSVNLSVLWPEEKLGDERIFNPGKQDAALAGPVTCQPRSEPPANKLGAPTAGLPGSCHPLEIEQVLAAFYPGDLNNSSIVIRLDFGNFCAYFPGDASSEVEGKLLERLIECQVLKVAHHGSKYATDSNLIEKLRPKLAVISVGKNSFGHPSEETVKILRDKDIKILRTDEDGEVTIESDGKKWGVVK